MTTKTTKRFQIGQTVYQMHEWSATTIRPGTRNTLATERHEFRIHARVVDGCGKKIITFAEKEQGSTLGYAMGRSVDADYELLFATIEEAKIGYTKEVESMKTRFAQANAINPEWYGPRLNDEFFLNETIFEV